MKRNWSRPLLVLALLGAGIAYFTFGRAHDADRRSDSTLEPLSSLRLWYRQPARDWMTQALPIGNAYMGAMLFGGIDEEHIQFNEESLWAGGPGEWEEYRGGNRTAAHRVLPEIRRLVKAGNYAKAHEVAQQELTGVIKDTDNTRDLPYWHGFGAYQPFGDIRIAIPGQMDVKDYSRSLDLRRAVAEVRYQSGRVTHRRQYFASYPARLLVFKLQNDAPEGQDYEIKLSSPHPVTFTNRDNRLIMKGALANNGMALEARMDIRSPGGGRLQVQDGKVTVEGTREVVLLLSAATDYLPKYPKYKGRDYAALNEATLNAARDKGFDQLLHEHLTDYRRLFDRVNLRLGKSDGSAEATDVRVQAYGKGSVDPGLEALFFQYARYLLISSSRPGSLPANLQGKWNQLEHPPWASDYHFNINIQMIYWPAEVMNLTETHEPLLEYVKSLREPGRVTAREYFNARGWVVNTMNNAFGYTAPGWALPWGYFPSASAWLGRHFWEHYAFSGDREFLRAEALPMMEEVALFWLDYLSEDNQGRLASIPSYSPEHGGISSGASMDQQIVWELFSNYLRGSELLSIDSPITKQVRAARDALAPPQIGRWGQLQEWSEDRDDPENKHRHVSHLYAVYPSGQIGPNTTPDLAKAAKVSLNARGDAGTGWSLAWKINLWARLADGERAYRLLRMAMRPAEQTAGAKYDGYASGVYANLLSTHPPFQLDGNMGAAAGMAEMLLQSHDGRIDLLPALPQAWKDGEVRGLRARGGYEVHIKWRDNQLQEAAVRSLSAGTVEVSYQGKKLRLETRAGDAVSVDLTALRGPEMAP